MQALKQVRSRWNQLSGLQQAAVVLIAVGIFFRLANLDGKILWHDEVYTNFRAAGYLSAEVQDTLFQNQTFRASEIRQFQSIKPNSTVWDTVRGLAVEDPQHPPPYFVMARVWMVLFGSSITADRMLPAVISLFSLPLMYALGLELFASSAVALMATVLLALSPLDILFAQTARQYSLMTATTIAVSWLLLRSIRTRRWNDWGLYAGTTTVGFYTQPLFGLTVVAHGVYLAGLILKEKILPPTFSWEHHQYRKAGLFYLVAIAIAAVLFLPWAWVLHRNFEMAAATTDWTRSAIPMGTLLNLWVFNVTALFMDTDISVPPLLRLLSRIPILVMIGVSLYTIYRWTPFPTWFFIVTSVGIPFLILALPDLMIGGLRSTVARFLIGCYPAIQLAVSYWIVHLWKQRQVWWRRMVLPMLVVVSVASCTISLFAETWWTKFPNYYNAAIADYIATTEKSVVISDRGDEHINGANLVSLSFSLPEETPFYLMRQPSDFALLPLQGWDDATLFVYRPSSELIDAVPEPWQIIPVNPVWNLWTLSPRKS